MNKNVASQKIQLFAFTTTDGVPKTGDAANLTAYVSKDHGAVTVLADTSATEMDATNASGVYVFDVAQAETNADELTFTAKSTTANISIVPRFISTLPPSFTSHVAQTGDNFALDLPTNTELATALGTADDAMIAAIAALNNLSTAQLATALGTADDAILAQVALVKAQTDKLTFTVTNQIDANIQYVNDVQVVGDGDATPWGPA